MSVTVKIMFRAIGVVGGCDSKDNIEGYRCDR